MPAVFFLFSIDHLFPLMRMEEKPCSNGLDPPLERTGSCMFAWDCIKRDGERLGICPNGFLINVCCLVASPTAGLPYLYHYTHDDAQVTTLNYDPHNHNHHHHHHESTELLPPHASSSPDAPGSELSLLTGHRQDAGKFVVRDDVSASSFPTASADSKFKAESDDEAAAPILSLLVKSSRFSDKSSSAGSAAFDPFEDPRVTQPSPAAATEAAADLETAATTTTAADVDLLVDQQSVRYNESENEINLEEETASTTAATGAGSSGSSGSTTTAQKISGTTSDSFPELYTGSVEAAGIKEWKKKEPATPPASSLMTVTQQQQQHPEPVTPSPSSAEATTGATSASPQQVVQPATLAAATADSSFTGDHESENATRMPSSFPDAGLPPPTTTVPPVEQTDASHPSQSTTSSPPTTVGGFTPTVVVTATAPTVGLSSTTDRPFISHLGE